MKNILSILLLFALYSCTPEDTINPETEDVENEQGDNGEETPEEVTKEKQLVKTIYDDGTFVKYKRNDEGNVLSSENENGQLLTEHTYYSDNLRESSKNYNYEDGDLDAFRLFFNSYDNQNRLSVRKRESWDYESMQLTDVEVDSLSYEGNKIVSNNYKLVNIGMYSPEYNSYIVENVNEFLEKEYDTEYLLNEDGALVNLKSYQNFYGDDTVSNLEFFYDEKLRCTKVTGEYTDYNLSSYSINVEVIYTDYERKNSSNRLINKNYLTSQSEPGYSRIFISNFIRNSSDYYLKNVKTIVTSESNISETENVYDYEFDEEGYPLSLHYSNPSSGYNSITTYEWE